MRAAQMLLRKSATLAKTDEARFPQEQHTTGGVKRFGTPVHPMIIHFPIVPWPFNRAFRRKNG